jgi:hypothetical protein
MGCGTYQQASGKEGTYRAQETYQLLHNPSPSTSQDLVPHPFARGRGRGQGAH